MSVARLSGNRLFGAIRYIIINYIIIDKIGQAKKMGA
jgi:hypothetical protein